MKHIIHNIFLKIHNIFKRKTGYFFLKKSLLKYSTYRSLIDDINIPEASNNNLDIINTGKKLGVSMRNVWSLIQSIEYLYHNKVEGVFVESGIYTGNSLILMQKIQTQLGLNKEILGYDTFEGMVKPSKYDKWINNPELNAVEKYNNLKKSNNPWMYASMSQVKNHLNNNLNDISNIKFIKGDVRETLNENKNLPDKISLLRLDTDFYESTKKELEILYPKLQTNGVLIIDDYGFFSGSKKAVDEYFKDKFVFKHYIDKSIRLIIKTN